MKSTKTSLWMKAALLCIAAAAVILLIYSGLSSGVGQQTGYVGATLV